MPSLPDPSSSPSTRPVPQLALQRQDSYGKTLHILSWSCLILCPILIALPPRKLDLFTSCLGLGTVLSANKIHRDRYGTGILARINNPLSLQPINSASLTTNTSNVGETSFVSGGSLPTERAKEFQARFKAERELQDQGREEGALGKIWYGDENPRDWKEKREKELHEKFEQGKGIADVIMDQIWEVWNWKGSGKPESMEEKKREE